VQDWQQPDAKNRQCAAAAAQIDKLIKPRMPFVDFLLTDTPNCALWPDDAVDAISARSTDTGRDVAV
jgi:hypothetical protein